MAKRSAGLLMFRRAGHGLEVLLVHPGGPLWAKKDAGAWSVPKGEYEQPEDALDAATREFAEETGFRSCGPYLPLGELRQPSGKVLSVWAFESDCNPRALVSNAFEMEWPPKSGRRASFAEVDRADWFTAEAARVKLHKGQLPFVATLEALLRASAG